ncbi:hypothetical protein HPB49_020134 [Dermacentor silvarum]|uniref:Uncharacterized protein n=1 Tax=Dermacentor silvarum TaxID=543639 RepID=A0ACB8DQU1_DERSI|nr:hypothetical protein HPB49_020134 [Dermacentor silvarum]
MASPRLPFMNITWLTHGGGQYGIKGQIVKDPIDVHKTVRSLPRRGKSRPFLVLCHSRVEKGSSDEMFDELTS